MSLALHRRAGWHGNRLHQDRSGRTRERFATFNAVETEARHAMRTSDNGPTRQNASQEAWRAMTEPETPTTSLKLAAGQALVAHINRMAKRLAKPNEENPSQSDAGKTGLFFERFET